MSYLEYILLGYFVFYPGYIYLTYQQEKQMVLNQPHKRLQVYRATMVHLWLPTLLLATIVLTTTLEASALKLQWSWHMSSIIGLVTVVVMAGYFYLSCQQLKRVTTQHQAIRKQMEYVSWLMPSNLKESRYFIFGVSVTAGICEELLFRGYLLQMLGAYMPTYGAVALSSLAFGLGHIYQGPIHVVKTACYGAIMALLVLATDTLLIAMAIHCLVDMYSGKIGYIVHHSHDNCDNKLEAVEMASSYSKSST